MKRIVVGLQYMHPWPNDAGLLVARQLGWFAEAGLDVRFALPDLHHSRPSDYLLRRDVDVALLPSSRLLRMRDAGLPVLGIAAINHCGLECVQTIRAKGIRRPRDLSGRRVSGNPTPRTRAVLRDLVSADGGDPDSVELVDVGYRELRPEQLAGSSIDATIGGYWAWDALNTSIPAEEHVIWPVTEWGLPQFHAYVLVAHQDAVERDPQALADLVAVTERGYRAAAADPGLVAREFEQITPYFSADLLTRSLALVAPTWTRAGKWGAASPDLMRPYAAWLARWGLIENSEVWRDACTLDFLAAPDSGACRDLAAVGAGSEGRRS